MINCRIDKDGWTARKWDSGSSSFVDHTLITAETDALDVLFADKKKAAGFDPDLHTLIAFNANGVTFKGKVAKPKYGIFNYRYSAEPWTHCPQLIF